MHNAAMASITIRDVPDDTRDELAARAAATGRSLQEYLKTSLVELAAREEPHVVMARIRSRKQVLNTRLSAKEIIALRDADRR